MVVMASGNWDLNQDRKPVIPLREVDEVDEGDGTLCFGGHRNGCGRVDRLGGWSVGGRKAMTVVVSMAITISRSSTLKDMEEYRKFRCHRLRQPVS